MVSTQGFLLLAILLLKGFATSAMSEELPSPTLSQRANETALAAQQALIAAGQEILMVKGTIRKVDPRTGEVEVLTSHGLSTLLLAPEAVKALKVGQPAVVELVPRQD